MKILFIGGTRFVGRHMAEAAVRRGHKVTLFHRGATGGFSTAGMATVLGDRTKNLDFLGGGKWDAVVDTCGYLPSDVSLSARKLQARTSRYLFVSSISVYQESDQPHTEDECLQDAIVGMSMDTITPENYGPLKAMCEREVQRTYGDRALIVRPGLVVGPGDYTDRFTYWPVRIRGGGDVLAPNLPHFKWQMIDGRDLGEFAISLIEQDADGVYNAVGPNEPLLMKDALERIRQAVNPQARFVWADPEFLREEGVEEWTDMPFMVFNGKEGLLADIAKGLGDGLTFRSLEETVKDTLAWKDLQPNPEDLHTGLPLQTQGNILDLWKARGTA